MKKRIRVACGFGASAAFAAFAACSGTTEPTVAPDAAASPAPTPPPAPSPTGSTPPTTPPADAGDSAPPRDATTGDAALDAADGALGVDAMDAADGYDGAPLTGSVETVAAIPGLTDFDFVGDHLVYRSPGFMHCTLPGCTDSAPLLGGGNSVWAVGDDESLHWVSSYHLNGAMGGSDYLDHVSQRFDSSASLSSNIASSSSAFGTIGLAGYHAGQVGVATVSRFGRCSSGSGTCTGYTFGYGGAVNTARVDRVRGTYHTNAWGAVAYYIPRHNPSPNGTPVAATFEGVDAPVPATPPTLVAISAAGPTVPHPTVVVLRAGNVEACPLATPCLAWLNLGALGSILNLDDQHLYIGTPTGLSRCALAEIGTAGTCTLVPHGPVEAVEEPLYLTATHAWYRSGTQVRRVLK